MKCQHCGDPAKRLALIHMRADQMDTGYWEMDPDNEQFVVLVDKGGYACCRTCWKEIVKGIMTIPERVYRGGTRRHIKEDCDPANDNAIRAREGE